MYQYAVLQIPIRKDSISFAGSRTKFVTWDPDPTIAFYKKIIQQFKNSGYQRKPKTWF